MKHEQLQLDFYRSFDPPVKVDNPHMEDDYDWDQIHITRTLREADEHQGRLSHNGVAASLTKITRAKRQPMMRDNNE